MLERGSRIDQAPIEKHPASKIACSGKIIESERDSSPSKGDLVHPWQRAPSAEQLLLDDPSARLFHRGIAALVEFRQQGRFSAA
jgi:hypothetical protein